MQPSLNPYATGRCSCSSVSSVLEAVDSGSLGPMAHLGSEAEVFQMYGLYGLSEDFVNLGTVKDESGVIWNLINLNAEFGNGIGASKSADVTAFRVSNATMIYATYPRSSIRNDPGGRHRWVEGAPFDWASGQATVSGYVVVKSSTYSVGYSWSPEPGLTENGPSQGDPSNDLLAPFSVDSTQSKFIFYPTEIAPFGGNVPMISDWNALPFAWNNDS